MKLCRAQNGLYIEVEQHQESKCRILGESKSTLSISAMIDPKDGLILFTTVKMETKTVSKNFYDCKTVVET